MFSSAKVDAGGIVQVALIVDRLSCSLHDCLGMSGQVSQRLC